MASRRILALKPILLCVYYEIACNSKGTIYPVTHVYTGIRPQYKPPVEGGGIHSRNYDVA